MAKRWMWSDHALTNLEEHEIDRGVAEAVLGSPIAIAPGRGGRSVLMGVYFDERIGERMLLRVVVEDLPDRRVVVTLYKTSRIGKYLPAAAAGEDR